MKNNKTTIYLWENNDNTQNAWGMFDYRKIFLKNSWDNNMDNYLQNLPFYYKDYNNLIDTFQINLEKINIDKLFSEIKNIEIASPFEFIKLEEYTHLIKNDFILIYFHNKMCNISLNNNFAIENNISEKVHTIISSFINNSSISLKHIYKTNMWLSYVQFDLSEEDYFPKIFNIFSGIDADKLIQQYEKSNENILILNWEPGTWKTMFIKYIIKKYKDSGRTVKILYCKDEDLVREDEFWIEILEEKYDYLILDDFDSGLENRKNSQESNKFITKLLSFSDWILKNNTKILITTNKELNDIDTALLRPGRCFDIIRFRKMNNNEAKKQWITIWKEEKDFQILFWNKEEISQAEFISKLKSLEEQIQDYILEEGISLKWEFLNIKSKKIWF